MFINFWYPICTSDELEAGQPYQSTVLGFGLVAFRDQKGVPHVLSDTCVHRGGSLGRGKVVDDCIQCPYHGWRYSGDGRCALIPSQREQGSPPARAKVDSYPVVERYGVVFAFLGDLPEGERPPFYEIPEYDQEGWRASDPWIIEIDCYYERSVENGLDPAHNEFVHPLQGFPKMNDDLEDVHMTEWGSGFKMGFGGIDYEETRLADPNQNPGQIWASSWHHGPNVLVTHIHFSGTSFVQYFYEAPQTGGHTRIYFINMRNTMLEPEHDERIMEINVNITSEDVQVLEGLWPVRTPDTTTQEILTWVDKPILRYREFLKDWESKGWRLDTLQLRQQYGDVAYALPSPGRRTAGNWVLDTAPLVNGAS